VNVFIFIIFYTNTQIQSLFLINNLFGSITMSEDENADWEENIHSTLPTLPTLPKESVTKNTISCLNCKKDFDGELDGFSDTNLLLCGPCKVQVQVELRVPPTGIFHTQ
jgi:hypothetical protein